MFKLFLIVTYFLSFSDETFIRKREINSLSFSAENSHRKRELNHFLGHSGDSDKCKQFNNFHIFYFKINEAGGYAA